jgi:phosphoribosylglycinamide formyltransferase-1
MSTLDLGVLISGTGTNLGSILDAIAAGALDARVRVVISNKADAKGLARAADAGVPTQVISHKTYPTREAFDAAVVETLRAAGVSTVVLAGFMRIVTDVLLSAFPHRVINIHPSLLPAFPGVDAQRQAFEYGAKVSGCTVHLVDGGVDSGPVLAQVAVPILEDDDVEALRLRILAEEHRLLVRVLSWLAEDRVDVVPCEGGRARVRIRPEARAR